MVKTLATLGLAVLVAAALTSCILDPDPKPPTPTPPGGGQKFEDLTKREHVLNNLELAYNQQDVGEYQRIFDATDTPGFIFFFDDGDVGGDIPVQWGLTEEVQSASNMFNSGGANPITSIDLDLKFDNAQWFEFTPECCPDETWYQTVVAYTFTIQADPDVTFITSGTPQAQFTVRQVDGLWKLVQWRDLASAN